MPSAVEDYMSATQFKAWMEAVVEPIEDVNI